MADLMKDVNYLRYYYTSDDASKDKDWCKNDAYQQYSRKVNALFFAPMGFQMWQISLANVAEKAALYKQVRVFKLVSFVGACSLSLWEFTNLRKQMTYYDRFYPEPTELQQKLSAEAAIFREKAYQNASTEARQNKL